MISATEIANAIQSAKGVARAMPGNAGGMVQNQHEHHVQTALAKKGQAKRLHILSNRLKEGDDHEVDRGRRAGQADDLQEMLPVADRFRVRDEAAGDKASVMRWIETDCRKAPSWCSTAGISQFPALKTASTWVQRFWIM